MSIGYILGAFPSYSEYFILHEIIELKKRGLSIVILSIQKGPAIDIGHPDLINEVIYSKSFFSPSTWLAHLQALLTLRKKYWHTLKYAFQQKQPGIFQLVRTCKYFSIAVYFWYQIKNKPIKQLHAHFLSLPATIGLLLSKLCETELSCSAHAQDIFTTPTRELSLKIRQATFVATCTKYNAAYLRSIAIKEDQAKIKHIYHGLDLAKWPQRKIDLSYNNKPLHILCIGRLVEKKGILFLLQAIKHLKTKGENITCSIIGDGPLRAAYQQYINENDLEGVVHMIGALPQKDIPQFYQQATVFVLPCIETGNGDKDGLPNVLVEALAVGVPVISTRVSAVPEIIEDAVTGILITEKDAAAIENAVLQLKNDTGLYGNLIKNGWEKVKEFNIENSTHQLYHLFNDHENR